MNGSEEPGTTGSGGDIHIQALGLIRAVTDRHPIRDLFVEDPPIERIIAELYRRHS